VTNTSDGRADGACGHGGSRRRRGAFSRWRRRAERSDWFVNCVAALGAAFVIVHHATLRIERVEDPGVADLDPSKIVYAFWHGRQYILIPCHRGSGMAVLTEVSWAGEIVSRILERLGYVTVRGSVRRKGVRAIVEMRRLMEQGRPAVFATDGPRGPAHASKPGILALAEKLGRPIVPVATSASPAWTVPGTWDSFLIPWPFARCRVAFGAPLRGAADGTLTIEELDRAIAACTGETDRAVGLRR